MAITLANVRNTLSAHTNTYTFTLMLSDGNTLEWVFEEDNTRKIISILDGFASGTPVTASAPVSAPTPAPTKASKPASKKSESKKYTPAKDADVKWKRTKNTLALDGYQGKDTFGILKSLAEQAGATYEKGNGFVFKTAKDAEAFAKAHTKVSGSDREAFRKNEWGW